jgi:hypothetical protein
MGVFYEELNLVDSLLHDPGKDGIDQAHRKIMKPAYRQAGSKIRISKIQTPVQ